METIIKKLVRWDALSAETKTEYRSRFEGAKYRSKGYIFRLMSLIPFSMTWLLRVSGSDKHQVNGHLYGYTYGRLFKPMRYRPIKFLEIGIGGYGYRIGGESLLAWRAFFPRAKIIACDIEPKPDIKIPGVKVYQIDQSSVGDLEAIQKTEGPFDIIIDDGSHFSRHQILTFKKLFGSLTEGGIYVVEDVMTSFWTFDGWDGLPVDHPDFGQTCVGFFADLSRYINFDEFEKSLDGNHVDPTIVNAIGSIYFEKNLIIIEKSSKYRSVSDIRRRQANV